MHNASNTEKNLKATVYIELNAELKELIGRAADEQNLPLNAFIAKILAKSMKRPDLAAIPKNRIGRPRKSIAI